MFYGLTTQLSTENSMFTGYQHSYDNMLYGLTSQISIEDSMLYGLTTQLSIEDSMLYGLTTLKIAWVNNTAIYCR